METKRRTEVWRTFCRAALIVGLTAVCCSEPNYAQTKPAPAYIPPACQGKPITEVPRATMLAQPATETKPNPPIAPADQLRLFNTLAKIIDEQYVYPDFNGLKWPDVVAEFRRKVEGGMETEAFYSAMEEFVKRLGDQHSFFDSPVKAAAHKTALAGTENYVGIGALFKPLPERQGVAILAIMPGSPADRGGLKMHDTLLSVDGLPVIQDGKVYQQRMRGPECSSALLMVASPGQTARAINIVRYRLTASVPIYAQLVKTADGARVGYLFLPSFFDATLPEQVKTALANFGTLDGLIIDNRMNSGGASSVLLPILSYFASGTLGHFVSRTGSRPLEIIANPINNSQKVPLVILVSKDTVSFGEIFSGVLQDIGRARIVGQASAGRVETLRGHNFPEGSQAWIAQESFEPIKSRQGWRGRGVHPDVASYADWDTFAFDNDPAVAAAIKLLGH